MKPTAPVHTQPRLRGGLLLNISPEARALHQAGDALDVDQYAEPLDTVIADLSAFKRRLAMGLVLDLEEIASTFESARDQCSALLERAREEAGGDESGARSFDSSAEQGAERGLFTKAGRKMVAFG